MTSEFYLSKLIPFFDDLPRAGTAPEELKRETPLLSSGILDSLNLFMLISHIEDEIGVAIEPDDVTPENFATLSAICNLVSQYEREPA